MRHVSRNGGWTVASPSCVQAFVKRFKVGGQVGLAALLMGTCVLAPALTQDSRNAGPAVTYKDGLLTIDPHGAPLHDVLNAIHEHVGFALDLPAGGMDAKVLDERIGPAPVKDVLVQLLYGCGENYIIQTASGDSREVQRILVSSASRVPGRQSVMAGAGRPGEDDNQEPQIYGAVIPANTSAEELTPIRPNPGQQPTSSATNVPGIPTNFNLQQAAAEANKTPGEILDELQKRQNEILDSQTPPPPQ